MFFLWFRRPPRSTRTATLFPYSALFRSRGLAVVGGFGLVLGLPGEEPAVIRRQFLGPAHHAGAALGGGGEEDLRAVGAHQLAAFHREGLGHDRHEVVAARRAHHRQRHAGIAGGCLRSEEHTSELQSLMRTSYAVFCLKKKNRYAHNYEHNTN